MCVDFLLTRTHKLTTSLLSGLLWWRYGRGCAAPHHSGPGGHRQDAWVHCHHAEGIQRRKHGINLTSQVQCLIRYNMCVCIPSMCSSVCVEQSTANRLFSIDILHYILHIPITHPPHTSPLSHLPRLHIPLPHLHPSP